MSRGLHIIRVKNFGILGDVSVGPLGRVNVLVGPNGSGKSTLLRVIQFLGDAARRQLTAAVEAHGGFERLQTRPSAAGKVSGEIHIQVEATVTKYAHASALDEYELELRPTPPGQMFLHNESFRFKRTAAQGRRITLRGASSIFSTRGVAGGR